MHNNDGDNVDQVSNLDTVANLIQFPTDHLSFSEPKKTKELEKTPLVDQMALSYQQLDQVSSYKSQFDWEPMRSLERRSYKNPIRGGIVFKSPFKLVNSHATCQQCLYSFEVDTYGRGCVHNCVYCYAKEKLSRHGYWNNPYPVPVDLNTVRELFYRIFETDKPSKWRPIMAKRIPIRVGSMSDSFMWMDDKLKVSKEFLRILQHYKYPCVIFTRSDLIAKDDYMDLLDPGLTSVQFSISSTNDRKNKLLEPGAPSAKRRLIALERLNARGVWTTVRINPLFPIFPDGHFTNPESTNRNASPVFDYFNFDMIDEIAATKTKSILAGFVRLSPYAIFQIRQATGVNLKEFFDPKINNQPLIDKRYSDAEIRYYYSEIKQRCTAKNVQFTTCYIGNGEAQFWRDQDLWSNKKDCCNVKGKVPAFKNDSRSIPFEQRIGLTNSKGCTPNDPARLHAPLGTDSIAEAGPASDTLDITL